MARLHTTLLPFLCPCLELSPLNKLPRCLYNPRIINRRESTITEGRVQPGLTDEALSRLNPPPEDYGRTIFVDKCRVAVTAGSGGHGCVSFLRDKYISDGPPNGGDGGTGGSIFIQAIRGETSLHKLARRRDIRAGKGKSGGGKGMGGRRGEDVLIHVPVGTVVREVSRQDPVTEEEERIKLDEITKQQDEDETRGQWRRDKWLLYPAAVPSDYASIDFPPLPRPRHSSLQPPAPISLDLSKPMDQPMLLAAGAVGGRGNPHFVSRSIRRPKFATKGATGMSIILELELKLLADVGFVGQPNAGKSTLLRALSNSRARVGDWQFTTLQPNIGTVVLDDNHGRPHLPAKREGGDLRTRFSIADIPGLIQGAHLNRGLGLDFLRHVERAQVLAFVIDLAAGDAVQALQDLWREIKEFENLKGIELNEESEHRLVEWRAFEEPPPIPPPSDAANNGANQIFPPSPSRPLPALAIRPITSKPWFVVGTKADLDGSRENFARLQAYLDMVAANKEPHPSGRKNAWRGSLAAIPVSAIRGEGVDRIPEWTVGLLED